MPDDYYETADLGTSPSYEILQYGRHQGLDDEQCRLLMRIARGRKFVKLNNGGSLDDVVHKEERMIGEALLALPTNSSIVKVLDVLDAFEKIKA